MRGLICYIVCLLSTSCVCEGLSQETVDYLADHVTIRYEVEDNIENESSYTFSIYMMNNGERYVTEGGWQIYFSHLRMIEPDTMLIDNGTAVNHDGIPIGPPVYGLHLYHVNGNLFKLVPTRDFIGWNPHQLLRLQTTAARWQVSRTQSMPNWYIVGGESTTARSIASTTGEELAYVAEFDTRQKWKRTSEDKYDPYTHQQRYDVYRRRTQEKKPRSSCSWKVVPTPVVMEMSDTDSIHINTDTWGIVALGTQPLLEAHHLSVPLGLKVEDLGDTLHHRFLLKIDRNLKVDRLGQPTHSNTLEAYTIEITLNTVTLTGGGRPGLFYATQTLLSLLSTHGRLPLGIVRDQPRFGYRGMHVDVARNFHPLSAILNVLNAMSKYKLNTLHLHLTDDEAWRLDIPGLPELVQVGSKQCHDPTGDECLMPQFGGKVEDGSSSKYYSVEDYMLILRHADTLHIQVIPEFDMPGHCHAATNAMLARYRKYKTTNVTAATEYLLTDLADRSQYLSIQMYTDNAVNPCVNSTYSFIHKVLEEVLRMHKDIRPLAMFNFGGDEVPETAWLKSPACINSGLTDRGAIKEYFVQHVSELVANQNLSMGAWEDGLLGEGDEPYDKKHLETHNVYAYSWRNVWTSGTGSRAYKLANAGYKTILSHGTHLYWDHPVEPDPEERGAFWATRTLPGEKTFSYLPDSVYDNIDEDFYGNKLTKQQVCNQFECTQLENGDNIIGVQGQLWSETVRTPEQLYEMIFPRLIALAERAWHKAQWEELKEGWEELRRQNWEVFTTLVGDDVLPYLDMANITYNIRPPGARIEGSVLYTNTEYPGQPVQYSTNNGETWRDVTGGSVILEPNVMRVHVVAL